jgi:hypothetical protein
LVLVLHYLALLQHCVVAMSYWQTKKITQNVLQTARRVAMPTSYHL